MGDGSRQLPGSLGLASVFPFVGRGAELELLRTLMPSAEGEGRRVVLLTGEPGSGKSRLVREFAREAAEHGALVLSGGCDAVVRTPYGPFVEALDHLVRVTDPGVIRDALGAGGGELARLLPDLAARVGELPQPMKADPDTERHRLHTAVTELFTAVGRRAPILLVLEDCHWADAPTLLLLRHVARSAWDARLLLVATFRDTEPDVPLAVTETLADLRRSDDVIRLRLAGLSEAEVTEFVGRASGSELSPKLLELAHAMRDLSEGNAFLVCELWRALVETRMVEKTGTTMRVVRPMSELGTPDSVREVVSQRLARLGDATTQLLELAAVAGSEFELELIRRAAGLGQAELLGALDEAIATGMLEELPSQRLSCRFTHELVRRALYDRLTRARRAELHLRVAEALEGRGVHSARALADLAHHFAAAAPLGGIERGIDYNLRAARAAAESLAFDEAIRRLRTAIDLGIDDAPIRAEAFLELGIASHRAGRALDALGAFTAAAETARGLGSAELLARAAIGYEDACWRPGIVSQDAVELLEEAITTLGDASDELRVGLLSGLARALDFGGARARGAIVRRSAVDLARKLDDRAGLANVLVRSYWSRGTSPLEEILAMLTEAKEIGEELRDNEIRAEAMAWLVPTYVALCDLHAARQGLSELHDTAEKTAQPFVLHVAGHYASALALCDGQLAEAEALAKRSRDWGRLLVGRDPSGTYGLQMFSVLREQGRLAELAPAVRILAAKPDRAGPWRPGLIVLLTELGMESDARRALAALAAEGLDAFRPSLWLATLTYLTDACAALGDEATAALLYPELESLAGANVMIGHLVCCYGAADRYLGMLAATAGDAERAEAHFEAALDLNERMGAPTWVAHTAYQYARLLLGRGGADRERGEALASDAARLAEELGLQGLRAKIAALGVAARPAMLPAGLSPREAQILGLVAQGLSNREIGSALAISEHTAANHIRSILSKTECANRTEAASFAHRHGLVPG
ncbi:MAG TPA: AAA family ATPase [Thermoleophilaceae bacterium]|nr:AAA family ATPase [Thermoleophilaceae bacterium]